MFGERSCLSLIVAGSSTNAALGGVSAGGIGTPELDVSHVILDQPEGSAGGVTPSKSSRRREMGSHVLQGSGQRSAERTSTRSVPSIAPAATILASATAAAATKNGQKISRSRLGVNAPFGFVVMESAVSLANSGRLPERPLLLKAQ